MCSDGVFVCVLVLVFDVLGLLCNFEWFVLLESVLGDDEVEIELVVIGLNFCDVMYVMGFLFDEVVEIGFVGVMIGMELLGCVVWVGRVVMKFVLGDVVFGFVLVLFVMCVRMCV